MLIYTLGKTYTPASAFRELLADAAFILALWLILDYFKVEADPVHFALFVAGSILLKFYRNLMDPQLYEVILNTSNRTVSGNFLSANGNKETVVIAFAECKIKIDQHRHFITREKSISIRFYKKRSFEFEIKNGRTGPSIEMLEDMIANLERMTHEIGKRN